MKKIVIIISLCLSLVLSVACTSSPEAIATRVAIAAKATVASWTVTATATATGTATPSDTPTATSTNTPTAAPTNTPTATPKPLFVIRDSAFTAAPSQKCEQLDIAITDITGDKISITFRARSEIPINMPLMRCYGGKYTWMGKLTYQGYTFASDENDPLQFKAGDGGYIYLKGKGIVTMPDKTSVTLPGAYSGADTTPLGSSNSTPTATANAIPTKSALANITAQPTGTPTPYVTPRAGVLFFDDFSSLQASKDNSWDFGPSSDGFVDLTWAANKYTIVVKKADWGWNEWPNGTFKDFGAEIEAQPNGEFGEYGIVFRTNVNADLRSYYVFGITSDGMYRVTKKVDGKWADNPLIPYTVSQFINPGGAKNRLGVLAIGSTLSFYINGTLVNTIDDTSIKQGGVGIFVYTYDGDHADVSFSRLTILTVEQAKIEFGK